MIISKHCIYLITNKINGKQYVGQTNNFKKRKSDHFTRNKQVINKAIQKYGRYNFKFEIIEEDISKDEIDDKEVYYINEVYNTFKGEGYNVHIGGNNQAGKNNAGVVINKEKAIKILELRERRFKYRDISKKVNVSRGTIKRVCDGESFICEEIDYSKYNLPKRALPKIDYDNLNKKIAIKVLKLREKGKTSTEIMGEFDLPKWTINSICRGKHPICREINMERFEVDNSLDYKWLKGQNSPNSKLLLEDVLYILEMKISKLTSREISKRLNISSNTVSEVCKGRHYLCKEVDINYELYDIIFNNSLTFGIDLVPTVREMRKKGYSQRKISEITGYNVNIIGCIDRDEYFICDFVDKNGDYDENISNFLVETKKEINDKLQEISNQG